MLRKRNRSTRPFADINVVPYIDVMLVLLVIFMITAPMLSQGVAVELPQANSEVLNSTDREPLIVSVNQQGDYFLNINQHPESPISAHDLILRVTAELELAKQEKQSLNVLVKGDKGVLYGKVVVAMSLLKQAGAEKVGLITEAPSNGVGDQNDV